MTLSDILTDNVIGLLLICLAGMMYFLSEYILSDRSVGFEWKGHTWTPGSYRQAMGRIKRNPEEKKPLNVIEFCDYGEIKLYPQQQLFMEDLKHSMDHIQPVVYNRGERVKTMTMDWPIGCGKTGLVNILFYIKLKDIYDSKEFKFWRAHSVSGASLPVRLMEMSHTIINISNRQVIKSLDDDFEYVRTPELPIVTISDIEKETGKEVTIKYPKDISKCLSLLVTEGIATTIGKEALDKNMLNPPRVYTQDQKKAILAQDPKAEFSDDSNTVYTRLDYYQLQDILDSHS
jgi:hypothetical protein